MHSGLVNTPTLNTPSLKPLEAVKEGAVDAGKDACNDGTAQ